MAAKKTFEFFFSPLLKKFFQDMGRDPNNLEMILLRQKAGQLLKDSNKVINFPQKESFMKQVEAMKKSGDLVDVEDINISEKITDRNMFNNSFLNKPTIEGQMEKITGASNRIKQIQKEQADMYKPKSDAEIAAKYDKQNQESIQRFKDKMKKDEPEDKADGGRIGYYTGGITDVEPSLDDIGHGSDALMARTRLMSPGAQATTSTGLNYLLAEDNDNMRIPFKGGGLTPEDYLKVKDMLNHYQDYKKSGKPRISKADFARAFFRENNAEGGRIGFAGGGDPRRRAFLKLMATLGGGIAGLKSGMIGLGEGTTKKAISETVKQSAGSGTPPPYFFKLVEKIRTMGDDTLATKDKAIAKKYKDYTMEEDFAGNIEIIKKSDDNLMMRDGDVYMSYKVDEVPVKGKKGSTKVEEYEEYTARPDAEGKMKDIEPGVPDEVVNEGSVFEDNMTEFGMTKKATGGRIGFSGGGIIRAIIANSAKKKGMSVTDFIKATNYKGLPPEVKMFLSAEDFAKLKSGQKEMYDNYIDMAKTRLEFQKNVEGGKNTPARELFESMEKTMDEQSMVPKTVTSDDVAEMELMVKNRFNEGRKDNAQGGLQTMLGE